MGSPLLNVKSLIDGIIFTVDRKVPHCQLEPDHKYKVWLMEEEAYGTMWHIQAVQDITDGVRYWVHIRINKEGQIILMDGPPNLILPHVVKGQLELL